MSRQETKTAILWITRIIDASGARGIELPQLLAVVRLKHGFRPETVRAWIDDLETLGKIVIEKTAGLPELLRSTRTGMGSTVIPPPPPEG